MNDARKVAGLWSLLGTFLLLAAAAFFSDAYGGAFTDLWLLLTGGVREIGSGHGEYLAMLGFIAALATIDLPLMPLACAVIYAAYGKHGKHALSGEGHQADEAALFKQDEAALFKQDEAAIFKQFFVIVLLEELFARWLFLGLIPKIPGFGGTGMFYILFFTGNGLWALIHLANYKEKKDRKILRVLPQFISGIFFTLLYVKYGLLGSVIGHFAFNAVLFSTVKMQNTGIVDVLTFVYAVAVAAVAYWMMERPPLDALAWLNAEHGYQIEGWVVKDYFLLVLFLAMGFVALAEILLYDKSDLAAVSEKPIADADVPELVGFAALAGAFLTVWMRVMNWIVKIALKKAAARAGLISLLLCFRSKARSASAMARSFWVGLPTAFVTFSACMAVSFWQAVGLMIGLVVCEIPLIMLKRADD